MNQQQDKFKTEIEQTTAQIDQVGKSLDTFDKLEKQYTDVNGKANVQFRIYYTDGEHQVDLVRGVQVGDVAAPADDNAVPAIDLNKEPAK